MVFSVPVKALRADCLFVLLVNFQLLVSGNIPNSDFESGNITGWKVDGRKDAQAKVISSKLVFDHLDQSRQFRVAGGWSDHPMAPLLKRSTNQHMLEISSDGYINVSTESTVRIEADTQYTVSLIVKSRNGGDAVYYLDVYAIGNDQRLPLGT